MRKLKILWRTARATRVLEELETWSTTLLAIGAALLLFATLKAQAALGAEFPRDVGAPTLLFQSASGFSAAAPLETDLRISVAGVVARVRVAQRFRNTGAAYVEAVYVLPLPDDAAVDRLTMKVGERLVEGEIHERAAAERVYGEAHAAGQRASLVRQTSANLFTTAVANIAPGEAVDITIEYLQTARYDAGEFSLRVPLTLTPRYGAPDTPEAQTALASTLLPEAPHTIQAMAAGARGTPAHEAFVHAVLAPGMPLEWVGSKSHELTAVHSQQASWKPADAAYALLMILPPRDAHALRATRREQIFVIDSSGSMGGPSIVQAKAALKNALGRLGNGDRFNIVDFDSNTSTLYPAPREFNAATHSQALAFVDGLIADGGTEIAKAVAVALAQPTTTGYLRQIVFITDGAVGAETSVFAEIKQRLGHARLFTIGIGSAPNSYFMRKAAEFGRGTYTHIGDTGDVAAKMTALFAKLEHVALTDVIVDWPEAAELYPPAIPDVYLGEPLVVTASFPKVADRPLLVTAYGQAGELPWKQTVGGAPSQLPGIAALWARRKIEHLVDSRVAGVAEKLIRELVIATALEHHLVSPYTSLVAVDKTPARSAQAALERRDIPNTMPAGAQWQAAFPRTATAAPLLRWLGACVLLAGLLLLAVQRNHWRTAS